MGFILKAIGAGIAMAGIDKARDSFVAESKRKNTVCHFRGGITKEEFYAIVKVSGKNVPRLTNIYADETMVYGTVRSQKNNSDWCFTIDYNDYGKLTGNYRLNSDNKKSEIPKLVADKIAERIKRFPEGTDELFDEEVYRIELEEAIIEEESACCPYCGERNRDENAKFCMHCGMRFRV